MVFTSWPFAVYVAVVFLQYYIPAVRTFQVQILYCREHFFYAYGQSKLLLLLLVVVVGTYAFLVPTIHNRAWLPAGVIFNLCLLGFFKYKFLFFAAPIATGDVVEDFLLNLPLPIGISFFVFHNISLPVDLPKQNRSVGPSDVFLYVIFFSQLLSGPITQARDFFPQIKPRLLAVRMRWMLFPIPTHG